ncbi:MAG: bifunctional diaminohydroxyphosphoribosylaminopyrimidine deaminase/5-amino-6-(5-phosphoribosylamino)uracil reductase RibD, partial [Planctomycetota bacterium]
MARSRDSAFLGRAADLAEKGRFRVEPNPVVGCVLVRKGGVVGEGWHAFWGGPHAEAMALRRAGRKARGATAYVTLEPCAHHGKTPPCADALIRAGVREVVYARAAGNPFTAGTGRARLRAGGVRVRRAGPRVGALPPLNRRRPYV